MASYLNVVEVAYRATLEEQDDTGVWFTHAMKNGGADVGLLLRGNAVNYAAKGQDASGLTIGSTSLVGPPRIGDDLTALMKTNAKVYVVKEDLEERGISNGDIIDGIEEITRKGIAKLFGSFDRILHW